MLVWQSMLGEAQGSGGKKKKKKKKRERGKRGAQRERREGNQVDIQRETPHAATRNEKIVTFNLGGYYAQELKDSEWEEVVDDCDVAFFTESGWKRVEDVHDPHDGHIGAAADEAGDNAKQTANHGGDKDGQNPHRE